MQLFAQKIQSNKEIYNQVILQIQFTRFLCAAAKILYSENEKISTQELLMLFWHLKR